MAWFPVDLLRVVSLQDLLLPPGCVSRLRRAQQGPLDGWTQLCAGAHIDAHFLGWGGMNGTPMVLLDYSKRNAIRRQAEYSSYQKPHLGISF